MEGDVLGVEDLVLGLENRAPLRAVRKFLLT